jgi:phosphatidylserine/phosphatidylglycerophosphate/cardiolipin synthase-like enzyme
MGMLMVGTSAQAKIEALFHPHDPTLEKIANWIQEADQRIDIAMYNMDTTDGSPVIRELKSTKTQNRLKKGDLRIRLLFEGYAAPSENEIKMRALEALGIDVRFLGRSVKIHHKFAVIDTGLSRERVISGSANWSLSSYRNYHENILFMENEPEITDQFQTEFERLWSNSETFGTEMNHSSVKLGKRSQEGLDVYFNAPQRLRLDSKSPSLTSQIVAAINGARDSLDIATTRVRIPEILEALSAAAQRGVAIRIVINQDDYRDLFKRQEWFKNKNIQLRIKTFNLLPSEYLTHQMHNKFMLVDGRQILTGSFNWSKSSEMNHIENLISLQGRSSQQVFLDYKKEFESIWDLGRDRMDSLIKKIKEAKFRGEEVNCLYSPMSLTPSEYRSFYKPNSNCKR